MLLFEIKLQDDYVIHYEQYAYWNGSKRFSNLMFGDSESKSVNGFLPVCLPWPQYRVWKIWLQYTKKCITNTHKHILKM